VYVELTEPPAVVTCRVTGRMPGGGGDGRAGAVTTIWVRVMEVMEAAAPPKVTVVWPGPEAKSVPVIVTEVPPVEGPSAGLTEAIVGGSKYS
jgi:hypothetical protein